MESDWVERRQDDPKEDIKNPKALNNNYLGAGPKIRCDAILEAHLLGDLSVHDLSGSLVLVDLSWVNFPG